MLEEDKVDSLQLPADSESPRVDFCALGRSHRFTCYRVEMLVVAFNPESTEFTEGLACDMRSANGLRLFSALPGRAGELRALPPCFCKHCI